MSLSTRKGSEFESWTSSNLYYSNPPWLLRESPCPPSTYPLFLWGRQSGRLNRGACHGAKCRRGWGWSRAGHKMGDGVADELWSWKLHKSIQIFTFQLGTYMSPVGGRSCSECRSVCCEDFNPCWVWVDPTQLSLAVGLVYGLICWIQIERTSDIRRCGLRSSGLSDEQMAEVAVTAAGHAAGHPKDVGKTDCWAVADDLHRGWQCCNCCGGSSRVCCLCGWPGQSTQNSGWPGLPGAGMTWEARKKRKHERET